METINVDATAATFFAAVVQIYLSSEPQPMQVNERPRPPSYFPRHALSVVVVCWKRKRNPTNDDDWLSPYRNSAPPLQLNFNTTSLNVVANYSCFATSIPRSMLLGGHPLNDWSMKFNDQVHRLSKLQKNMVHLSRRIGPRQHGLLIDLVNLHDRLRSLTSHFQRNLLHFQRDLSPLIETEKNMLKSTGTHVTNTNAIDNTSFHASTTLVIFSLLQFLLSMPKRRYTM
ncbi:hypothetical protein T12_3636 [Trichinella patagoniensis]|uniref:Uncharacterized protein n=1 Tax=Trichinella patagoniensis TaxID=990121 RepID=A0A0V0ZQT3_9BILA|nr:hypothetical protein T12_3636 [Trichinella patagoniensis]